MVCCGTCEFNSRQWRIDAAHNRNTMSFLQYNSQLVKIEYTYPMLSTNNIIILIYPISPGRLGQSDGLRRMDQNFQYIAEANLGSAMALRPSWQPQLNHGLAPSIGWKQPRIHAQTSCVHLVEVMCV